MSQIKVNVPVVALFALSFATTWIVYVQSVEALSLLEVPVVDVKVIIPVPDLPSMIISREGGLIAYGWVNEKGHAEFKLAVPHAELS